MSRTKETALRLLLDCMGSEMYLSAVFHPCNFPELEYQDLVDCEYLALACSITCKGEYVYRLSAQDRLYGPRSEAALDFTVTRRKVGLLKFDGSKPEVACLAMCGYGIHKIGRYYGITHLTSGLSLVGSRYELNQGKCKTLLIEVLTACNKRGIDPSNFRSYDDRCFVFDIVAEISTRK